MSLRLTTEKRPFQLKELFNDSFKQYNEKKQRTEKPSPKVFHPQKSTSHSSKPKNKLLALDLLYLSIGKIKNLREINTLGIQNLKLTDPLASDEELQTLSNMPLRTLELSHCSKITAIAFRKIPFIFLHTLNLSFTSVTDKNLQYIPPSVKRLDLSDCPGVTDQGLYNLAILHVVSSLCLDKLELSNCAVTDKGLPYLSMHPLKYLTLNKTKITSVGLEALKDLKLISLALVNCDIDDKGLAYLSRTITKLNLSDCLGVTDLGLCNLAILHNESSLSLERLTLSGCNITNKGLPYLTVHPVRYLTIYRTKVTNAGLEALKDLKLIGLSLGKCFVDNGGLAFLPRTITSLDLSFCEVTDEGLASLRTLSLLNLNLSGLNITNRGVSYLSSHPLEFLDVSQCSKIAHFLKGKKSIIRGVRNIKDWILETRQELPRKTAVKPLFSTKDYLL